MSVTVFVTGKGLVHFFHCSHYRFIQYQHNYKVADAVQQIIGDAGNPPGKACQKTIPQSAV